ncbi:hypothetical protein BJ322DRAFT_1102682 [Thelephora terrestris]|uniref:Uncharacterized protein n=1 Tax=Thelephora terrestris TaxID=56493 RepID=A0A9P6LB98_9AGAM|nr:hypothetical protein BJ322DRAFT_1102682 [Thelephora terrestris]
MTMSDEHPVPSGSSQKQPETTVSLPALDIPSSDLDLDFIIAPSEPIPEQSTKVQKRASNVMKLSLEHKKLEEELRIMNERLKAAEQAMTSKRGSTLRSPSSL